MIRLVFGIHNHQPVGNFDHVFLSAYERCYLPFIKTIANHPSIKICLHTTGPLYQWMEENKPEWFDLVKKQIDSGQIEIMGGGFYEPILSVIPGEDAVGQITKMSNYVEEKFGVAPSGMWTAERVWEPSLPSIMATAGMNYTVLDDTHFRCAGLKDDELLGYYITEDEGLPVYVFPISKFLRYSIPFKPPEETIRFLKKLYDEKGDIVVVYADDGEKFGFWPGTYNTCYNERWLERFFHQLTENVGWIKPVFFSEVIEETPPAGRVYLPSSSYAEMGQWSLPADSFEEYEQLEKRLKEEGSWDRDGYLVRGGFWRNFMSKYPEANNMHKKMMHVTYAIRDATEEKALDDDVLKEAIDLKWQGQCNCPYWHGVFGGLYLNHLRHATYSRFLKAESLLESVKKDDFLEYEIFDFDFDGQEEAILKNRYLNIYVSPSYGGSIFELDYKPSAINLLDTMTRRKEGYHSKVSSAGEEGYSSQASIHDRFEAKEQGLEKYLVYDWHRRVSFLDHFLKSDIDVEKFSKNDYDERGNFVNQPYDAQLLENKDKLHLVLQRDGRVWINNVWASILIRKAITLKSDSPGFEVIYKIENSSESHLDSIFGIETSWALLAGDSPDRYYHVDGKKLENSNMVSAGEISDSETLGLRDEAFGYDIILRSDRMLDWWRFPLETISLSEGGFERNYQQSVVMPVINLSLPPGEDFDLKLFVDIKRL
ncbi:MAG: alpha-amylase/4-alpha-glucanotransferase domain-containing protein [candidate division Zixibacteria bacterium]